MALWSPFCRLLQRPDIHCHPSFPHRAREDPLLHRRPGLLSPPHFQGRRRSGSVHTSGLNSRRGSWRVPSRCTDLGRCGSHWASRPWRTGPRRHRTAWWDEPSPLMPSLGRWGRRKALPVEQTMSVHTSQPFNLYRLPGVGAGPVRSSSAAPRRTLTTALLRRSITNRH